MAEINSQKVETIFVLRMNKEEAEALYNSITTYDRTRFADAAEYERAKEIDRLLRDALSDC